MTENPYTLITEPADGIPAVCATTKQIQQAAAALEKGSGPFAIDTERASGFRYSGRAYLIQIRRAGSGTFLIDPTVAKSLSSLGQVLATDEWILHAADQDLPCLRELEFRPPRLFDTEVAAQLVGLPHISLSGVCESLLGVTLAKEHSQANWSQRPLPLDWLNYAALDVEFLLPLREELAERLRQMQRWEWAQQEFDHILQMKPAPVDPNRWRHLSGAGKLRERRQLAILQALWEVREELAEENDLAPGLIITNRNLVELARRKPKTRRQLLSFEPARRKGFKPFLPYFVAALRQAWLLDEKLCPPAREPRDFTKPPKPRSWEGLNPVAAKKLQGVTSFIHDRARKLEIPQEVLLRPKIRHALVWNWEKDQNVAEKLRELGARPWQIEQVSSPIETILRKR